MRAMHLSFTNHCAMLTHMETGTDLIGSSESCRLLSVHPATLSRWVGGGILTPAHKLPGKNGAYLFHRADVEKLAAEKASA